MLAFTYSLNNVLFETHSHSSLKLHNVLHAHTYHNVVVIKKVGKGSWVWCYIPIIVTLMKLRQEDYKFMVCLGYIANSRLPWATQ